MADKNKPVVHVDGTDYPLDSFPEATLAMLEFDCLNTDEEQVEELETRGYTPDLSIKEVHREWQKSKALVNGAISRAYEVGRVDEGIVCFAPDRDPEVLTWVESDEGDLSRNDELTERLEWLRARGNNVVWVRRADSGDGILLPQTIYMVAFTNQGLEAHFLNRYPEVAA